MTTYKRWNLTIALKIWTDHLLCPERTVSHLPVGPYGFKSFPRLFVLKCLEGARCSVYCHEVLVLCLRQMTFQSGFDVVLEAFYRVKPMRLCEKIANEYANPPPSGQACYLQSVKMTDSVQIFTSMFKEKLSNMGNIWLKLVCDIITLCYKFLVKFSLNHNSWTMIIQSIRKWFILFFCIKNK